MRLAQRLMEGEGRDGNVNGVSREKDERDKERLLRVRKKRRMRAEEEAGLARSGR